MSVGAEPLPHRGRPLHPRLLWLLVGVLAVAGIAAAVGWIAFSGGTQATTAPAPPRVQAEFRALVSGSIPGAILFVRDGGSSYALAAGYADDVEKVPMRADDVFPIGSTTKTYTAVLVMRLAGQGKVELDAPVARYLPDLLPDGDRITVRELLSHTSGLYDFATDPRFMAPYLQGKFDFAWTPQQMVGFATVQPLLFTPGTRFSYSNTNYVVLALLAERVDGKSYERQLRDYVFRPLGLDHTSLPAGNETLPDVHGYVGLGAAGKTADATPVDSATLTPSFAWGVGGIRSTAEDEADFFRALFSGELLPGPQVAAMEDASLAGGAYGLGIMPTGGFEGAWQSYTKAITTTCGRAWGHGGAFPGYDQLPISSPDGSRQAVLLVNTDEERLTQAQYQQVFRVLADAYCSGVGP